MVRDEENARYRSILGGRSATERSNLAKYLGSPPGERRKESTEPGEDLEHQSWTSSDPVK